MINEFEKRHPRDPAGKFVDTVHHESSGKLEVSPSVYVNGAVAERAAALAGNGYLQPVALVGGDAIASDREISDWWANKFMTAEYRSDGSGFPQMPDDYTPNMTGGTALSSHRRTHRRTYGGAGMNIRMPSATSVKRFSTEQGNMSFDVPVEAHVEGKAVTGWVRVTMYAGGRWDAVPLNWNNPEVSAAAAESVSAVLEARRPTRAVREVGAMLEDHKRREQARGVPHREVVSHFIRSIAYDPAAGTLHTRMKDGRVYGHRATPDQARAILASRSPGKVFNAIRQEKQPVAIENCSRCGNTYSVKLQHLCAKSFERQAPQEPNEYKQKTRRVGAFFGKLRGHRA